MVVVLVENRLESQPAYLFARIAVYVNVNAQRIVARGAPT
jgi:hypothetical protein